MSTHLLRLVCSLVLIGPMILWPGNYSFASGGAQIKWEQTVFLKDIISGKIATDDGGYLLVGKDPETGHSVAVKLGQDGKKTWETSIFDGDYHSLWSFASTSDGGCVVVEDSGDDELLVTKLGGSGRIEWRQNVMAPFSLGSSVAVKETTDGGYMLAGTTYDSDILLLKLSSDGTKKWEKLHRRDISEIDGQMELTSDGGIVLGAPKPNKLQLFKFNQDGKIVWEKVIEQRDIQYDHRTFTWKRVANQQFIVADSGSQKLSFTLYNSQGNTVWKQDFSAHEYLRTYIYSIAQTKDKGFILAGEKESSFFSREPILIKLDSEGKKQWERTVPTSDSRLILGDIYENGDDGYTAAVTKQKEAETASYLFAFDHDGNLKWEQRVKAPREGGRQYLTAFEQAKTDGFILAHQEGGEYTVFHLTAKGGVGLSDLRLSHSVVHLTPAESIQIRAEAVHKNSSKDDVTDEVVWSSSNRGVATVANGKVEALQEGEAVITATYLDQTASVKISVSNVKGIQWEQKIGSESMEIGRVVKQTNDGGFIIAAETQKNGNVDLYVVKTNEHGEPGWTFTYGTKNKDEYATDMIQTSDGGYVITGTVFESTNDREYPRGKLYVLKVSASGKKKWEKTYENAYGGIIQQTKDGGFILAAHQAVLKLSKNGKIEWQKAMEANDVAIDRDGGFLISSDEASTVTKLDKSGKTIWNMSFSGGYGEIHRTEDGGFVAVRGNVLERFDEQGHSLWKTEFYNHIPYVFGAIKETNDGGFLLVGTTNSDEKYSTLVKLIKISKSGSIEYDRNIGYGHDETGKNLALTSDGGIIIVGSVRVDGNLQDVYLIKLKQ